MYSFNISAALQEWSISEMYSVNIYYADDSHTIQTDTDLLYDCHCLQNQLSV